MAKKYGFIDKSGKMVIELQFDWVSDFSEGLAKVEKDGKYYFLDKNGKVVFELSKYDYVNVGDFSEGLALVAEDGESTVSNLGFIIPHKMYGFIDKSGKVVIEPQFYDVLDFSEGFTRVEIARTGLYGEPPRADDYNWGFIDKSGKVVIEPQFNYVSAFSEGLACVRKDDKEPDILIKLFGEELGQSDELINDYYGRFIEEIEDYPDDIKLFAETLTEELRDDYGGKLSEDERSKFHYALMFNSMTIAYKRMLKQLIKDGDQEEEDWDEDDLDITKGLVSNEHYTKMLEGLDVHAGAEEDE